MTGNYRCALWKSLCTWYFVLGTLCLVLDTGYFVLGTCGWIWLPRISNPVAPRDIQPQVTPFYSTYPSHPNFKHQREAIQHLNPTDSSLSYIYREGIYLTYLRVLRTRVWPTYPEYVRCAESTNLEIAKGDLSLHQPQ